MPHRLVRRTLSWLELRPRVANLLAMFTAVIALVGFGATLWLHSDDSHRLSGIESQRQADHAASVATSKVLNPVVCHLVYTYVHPVGSTQPVPPQIVAVWHEVGVLVGCPYGTKP